jgi:hypothetical protein
MGAVFRPLVVIVLALAFAALLPGQSDTAWTSSISGVPQIRAAVRAIVPGG